MPFSTFYAPIVKLILCQRPSGILPSTPHAQHLAIRFHRRRWLLCPWMALQKVCFYEQLRILVTLSLPHKTPSSNILWAALLKIDNASCSKYFIREVSQSWSQRSCQALGAMLQSARTKFFCSDNYQATSCWDLFPVEILGDCNQSATRVKLIITSESLSFKLGVISEAGDSIYLFRFQFIWLQAFFIWINLEYLWKRGFMWKGSVCRDNFVLETMINAESL